MRTVLETVASRFESEVAYHFMLAWCNWQTRQFQKLFSLRSNRSASTKQRDGVLTGKALRFKT